MTLAKALIFAGIVCLIVASCRRVFEAIADGFRWMIRKANEEREGCCTYTATDWFREGRN